MDKILEFPRFSDPIFANVRLAVFGVQTYGILIAQKTMGFIYKH